MEKDFNDIFDRLTYEMFKLSDGNPYIAQDWVRERNKMRKRMKTEQQILEKN